MSKIATSYEIVFNFDLLNSIKDVGYSSCLPSFRSKRIKPDSKSKHCEKTPTNIYKNRRLKAILTNISDGQIIQEQERYYTIKEIIKEINFRGIYSGQNYEDRVIFNVYVFGIESPFQIERERIYYEKLYEYDETNKYYINYETSKIITFYLEPLKPSARVFAGRGKRNLSRKKKRSKRVRKTKRNKTTDTPENKRFHKH
jgi:hypothetical protein